MSEIPEDIRKAATACLNNIKTRRLSDSLIEDEIAAALLAERARCAELVMSFKTPERRNQIHGETYDDAEIIAEAIMTS